MHCYRCHVEIEYPTWEQALLCWNRRPASSHPPVEGEACEACGGTRKVPYNPPGMDAGFRPLMLECDECAPASPLPARPEGEGLRAIVADLLPYARFFNGCQTDEAEEQRRARIENAESALRSPAAGPREWTAATIKDAPEFVSSWWLFNCNVLRWQRFEGQRSAVIEMVFEGSKFTHAVPILPPPQPPTPSTTTQGETK